jgi:hypothetical protein
MAIFGRMGLKTTPSPIRLIEPVPVKSWCRNSLYEVGIEAGWSKQKARFTKARRQSRNALNRL